MSPFSVTSESRDRREPELELATDERFVAGALVRHAKVSAASLW